MCVRSTERRRLAPRQASLQIESERETLKPSGAEAFALQIPVTHIHRVRHYRLDVFTNTIFCDCCHIVYPSEIITPRVSF